MKWVRLLRNNRTDHAGRFVLHLATEFDGHSMCGLEVGPAPVNEENIPVERRRYCERCRRRNSGAPTKASKQGGNHQ